MRPRSWVAVTAAIVVALAGAGTAAAMTADSTSGGGADSSSSSSDRIKPKQLLPSPDPSLLPDPLEEVVGTTTGGSGGVGGVPGTTEEEGTAEEESPDGGSKGTDRKGSTRDREDRRTGQASTDQAATGAAFRYGGWWRFFDPSAQGFAPGSVVSTFTEIRTVSAPTSPGAGTVRISQVSATLPPAPPHLWVLLPLGFVLLAASSFAVFEPIRRQGRMLVLVSSARRSARELPAGMARTAGRGLVRAFRGFGGWPRR